MGSVVRTFAIAFSLLALTVASAPAAESQPLLLWPNGAPGSEDQTSEESVRLTAEGEHVISNVHRPSVTPFLPDRAVATGAAVIVIPGGGHREIWIDHEGYREARWLSERGIAAFVLKYRLALADGSHYTIEGTELSDVQQAIRLVRSRAAEFQIAPDRIGVMGFSAGGELSMLAATRYESGSPAVADNIDHASARPDFVGLIYPGNPHPMDWPRNMPPVFLLCGEKDAPAISDGVPLLFLSLKHASIPAELHIISGVGHGFGMRDSNPPAVAIWPQLFFNWLGARGFLTRN